MVEFTVLADHRVKLQEIEKKDKYLDLARELKKTVEYEIGRCYTNCNWCSLYSHQRINKRTGSLRKKEDVWESSNLLDYWDRTEYWEEHWILKETCYHSNTSERPSANLNVKLSRR